MATCIRLRSELEHAALEHPIASHIGLESLPSPPRLLFPEGARTLRPNAGVRKEMMAMMMTTTTKSTRDHESRRRGHQQHGGREGRQRDRGK